jgi:hypothetical protein
MTASHTRRIGSRLRSQDLFQSKDAFEKKLEVAKLDDVFQEWGIASDVLSAKQVFLADLIRNSCGDAVLDATSLVSSLLSKTSKASPEVLPRLYLVGRKDGPKLWFLD